MTEEKKETNLEEKEEENQKTQEEAQEQIDAQKNIEETLKIEKERRLKAEEALEETRKKARERIQNKKKEEEENFEEKVFENKENDREILRSILEEERENIRKEMKEERALDLANSISENPQEAQLFFEVWKNRNLQGTLSEQMNEAKAIANFLRVSKQKNELERKILNKDGKTDDNLNNQRKTEEAEPKVNEVDKTALRGYTWDNSRKAYKKVIAGGNKVFFVSKDFSKRWVEDNQS